MLNLDYTRLSHPFCVTEANFVFFTFFWAIKKCKFFRHFFSNSKEGFDLKSFSVFMLSSRRASEYVKKKSFHLSFVKLFLSSLGHSYFLDHTTADCSRMDRQYIFSMWTNSSVEAPNHSHYLNRSFCLLTLFIKLSLFVFHKSESEIMVPSIFISELIWVLNCQFLDKFWNGYFSVKFIIIAFVFEFFHHDLLVFFPRINLG